MSIYYNEYKTKSHNKNAANKFRYFLESSFFGANRLLVLVSRNHGNIAKRFSTQKYYLPKI